MMSPSAFRIPGGEGAALRLPAGQCVRLRNTYGTQVVDTWCLAATDPAEYLSVEHTRRMNSRIYIREGDTLYSNRRNGLLVLEQDSSGCRHDTLCACCDAWLYKFLGCAPGHRSCHANFVNAVAALGLSAATVPNPVNFWMNVPVGDGGHMTLEPPVSRPGDCIVLRALVDVTVVFSACPMDITPVNGGDRNPRAVTYEMLG